MSIRPKSENVRLRNKTFPCLRRLRCQRTHSQHCPHGKKKSDGPRYDNCFWTATPAHCIFGQGNTCRVFGIIEDPHSFAPRHEKIDPSKSFGKASEFRSGVAARRGSWKRQMSGITRNWVTKNSDKAVGRDGSNSPAGQFCAVNLTFDTLRGWRVSSQETQCQSFWL